MSFVEVEGPGFDAGVGAAGEVEEVAAMAEAAVVVVEDEVVGV